MPELIRAETPGLVCAHHHLYSALARGMPAPPRQPHSFTEILEQVDPIFFGDPKAAAMKVLGI